MRNIWLLTKREYLERVRTKAFLIFTMLTPALMFCLTVLPAKMMTMRGGATHIVVVTPDDKFGAEIRDRLIQDLKSVSETRVDVNTDISDAAYKNLKDRVTRHEITGFLWITPDAIAKRNVQYTTSSASDFLQQRLMSDSLQQAFMQATLTSRGLSRTEIGELTKSVKIDAIDLNHQQAGKHDEESAFISGFFMLMLMYMTVLIYGMNVMRSVLEEKNSRVLEVLLSAATPREIMASKILGVGAVGLTQIGIWGTIGIVLAPFAASAFSLIHLGARDWAAFAVFFLLGYVLYSSLCAAVGAAMNSEQEAQQVNFVIAMPLILSLMIAMFVIRQPDSTLAVVFSYIPFCAPIIMMLRIVLQTPPWWQIAISIGIMLATIYVLIGLCAKIYRVGILMYGKRPTLPEIMKWLKYE